MMIQGNRPLDRCDDPDEHTGPALQLQDQKEQQTNQPDEGKRPMRPKLNSELEPRRQAPALLVHLQKLAAVFTFLDLKLKLKKGLTTRLQF